MKEDLIKGLEFAVKHKLAQREMEALLQFIRNPYTNDGLAETMGIPKTTLHRVIQLLKLKGILELKGKDGKKKVYRFNDDIVY